MELSTPLASAATAVVEFMAKWFNFYMAHICENDMIQIKDISQIVATLLQFSTEEYFKGKVP